MQATFKEAGRVSDKSRGQSLGDGAEATRGNLGVAGNSADSGDVDSRSENCGQAAKADGALQHDDRPVEYGGPKGADPTRFGDWEKNGRCIDF